MTPPASDANPKSLVDQCIHCGLCLPACPTYDLTGNELDSPRGRIDLVRGLVDGSLEDRDVARRHLSRCLGCRACETACPSGVQYGQILEAGRATLHDTARSPATALLKTLAEPAATRALMRATSIARGLGLVQIGRLVPGAIGRMAAIAPDARWTPWSASVPRRLPATGSVPGGAAARAVALLPGCVMDQGFAQVHEASARLLRAAGFDVLVPPGPLCCGALHAHTGDLATATTLGERLARSIPAEAEALIVDAAGCGSHLKESPGPWRRRTFDVLEWLDRHGTGPTRGPAIPSPQRLRPLRVAYQDPCHLLHGQRIREAPRRLLLAHPGVELVELGEADRCCGSAGVYNLTEPELAGALLLRKVALIRAAAPDVVASANPGCMLQLAAGLRTAGIDIPVVHVVEILAGVTG